MIKEDLISLDSPERWRAALDGINHSFSVSLLPEGQTNAAALIWYAVKRLKSLQIPLLNLGGGSGSLGEFKRRFGAGQLSIKTLKQLYRPEIYKQLCWQANVDADDISGYFPAYRR